MSGYFLTAAAIGLIGGVMAVYQSLFPHTTSSDKEQRR
jgi:hypothetical protein